MGSNPAAPTIVESRLLLIRVLGEAAFSILPRWTARWLDSKEAVRHCPATLLFGRISEPQKSATFAGNALNGQMTLKEWTLQ